MKTNKLRSILMMFSFMLGSMVIFSSCSNDDDEPSIKMELASFENTLWRADMIMPDPMISDNFVSVETQETRIFFGEDGDALVCIKYKEVNSVTGYESGEMINYAKYSIENDVLQLTTYKSNDVKEGHMTFKLKKGDIVSDYYTAHKVRNFNYDDKSYFDEKILYYGPDEKRYDFEIAGFAEKESADWFKYDPYETVWNLYVNVGFGVGKEQKLYERGLTEVLATIRISSGRLVETKTISRAVYPGQDVMFNDRMLLEKKNKTDEVTVTISYKIWDHRKNVYKNLDLYNSFKF